MVSFMLLTGGVEGSEAVSVDERIALAAGLRNTGDAALVDLVVDVLADGSWQGDGINSPAHWVGWKFGVTRGRARQIVTTARRLPELPFLAEMFGEGRLSFEQAHCVARYCPVGFDEAVSDFATFATMHQLRHTLRQYSFDAEASLDPDDGDQNEPTNRASKGFGDDGRYRLSLDVDAATGGGVDAAIEQAWARLRAAEPVGELNLADAVADCFTTSAAADPSQSRKASNAMLLHIDIDRLLEAGAEGLVGHLHLGPVLGRSLTELLSCDATAQMVIRVNGRPINLGRSTATIPRWLRRLVQNRDGGCRFCGSVINVDVHHIIHWANGGPTDEINLVTLCSRHHHAVHRGELHIVGNPTLMGPVFDTGERLRFLNRHGNEIGPSQKPRPPGECRESESPRRYDSPTGERLQPWAVWFGRNKPNLN